jgi:hypothetical protein
MAVIWIELQFSAAALSASGLSFGRLRNSGRVRQKSRGDSKSYAITYQARTVDFEIQTHRRKRQASRTSHRSLNGRHVARSNGVGRSGNPVRRPPRSVSLSHAARQPAGLGPTYCIDEGPTRSGPIERAAHANRRLSARARVRGRRCLRSDVPRPKYPASQACTRNTCSVSKNGQH